MLAQQQHCHASSTAARKHKILTIWKQMQWNYFCFIPCFLCKKIMPILAKRLKEQLLSDTERWFQKHTLKLPMRCSRWAVILDKWVVIDFWDQHNPTCIIFSFSQCCARTSSWHTTGPDVQLTVRQNITREAPGLLPHPKYSNISVLESTTYLTNFAGLVLEH